MNINLLPWRARYRARYLQIKKIIFYSCLLFLLTVGLVLQVLFSYYIHGVQTHINRLRQIHQIEPNYSLLTQQAEILQTIRDKQAQLLMFLTLLAEQMNTDIVWAWMKGNAQMIELGGTVSSMTPLLDFVRAINTKQHTHVLTIKEIKQSSNSSGWNFQIQIT